MNFSNYEKFLLCMMKKVLFTHSYFYRFDPKQWKAKQPFPPLATITAASFIRNLGYEVTLFDTALRESPEEIFKSCKRKLSGC
uniref:hypothetical protein n=1 Tax=Ignavibacterium sp. TaxID=2651167 RepID=UPI00404B06F1